jgi:hypothetical protein
MIAEGGVSGPGMISSGVLRSCYFGTLPTKQTGGFGESLKNEVTHREAPERALSRRPTLFRCCSYQLGPSSILRGRCSTALALPKGLPMTERTTKYQIDSAPMLSEAENQLQAGMRAEFLSFIHKNAVVTVKLHPCDRPSSAAATT